MPEGRRLAPGGGLRSFNLLPWRARRQRMRKRRALFALACAAAAALGLLAVVELSMSHRINTQERRAAQIKAAISAERRAANTREPLEARLAQTALLLAEVERIRRSNSTARLWLEELPERVPSGLRLTGLSLRGQAWQLRGRTVDLSESAALLESVRKMSMVSEVRIEQIQLNPDATRNFVLAGKFRP